jgi:hypothetical protein
MTSVFLVVYPSLVTSSLRWSHKDHGFSVCEFNEQGACITQVTKWFWVPFYIYLFWQISYFLKTEFIDVKNKKEDQPNQSQPNTTYRSFYQGSTRYGSSILLFKNFASFLNNNWVNLLNPIFVFGVIQQFYLVLTILPFPFSFSNYKVNLFFLISLCIAVISKGSIFYFSIFIATYSDRLKRFQIEASLSLASEKEK